MGYIVLEKESLPPGGNTYEFEGCAHADTEVSFIWVDMAPGEGVRLHKHPYKEIFIVQEGDVSFTVGTATQRGQAGQIIIVPEGAPHKFVNSGKGQLRQIDIHISHTFITDWLED